MQSPIELLNDRIESKGFHKFYFLLQLLWMPILGPKFGHFIKIKQTYNVF